MLRLLSDENFNGDIVRGLFLLQPNLDLLRVQDVGLREIDELLLLNDCSEQSEWKSVVLYLPL